MNNIVYHRFLIILLIMTTLGCKKTTELNVLLEKAPEIPNDNPLDIKLNELKKEYGSTFAYKWDRYVFSKNAVADPADIKDVLPYIEIMEEVFFKALKAVQEPGKNFVQVETPINFFLMGSGINYGGKQSFGEGTAGQAGNIQPNRLTLGGLNEFGVALRAVSTTSDAKFLSSVLDTSISSFPGEGGLVSFLYHEFTHYIDAKHDIPKNFQEPAFANYLRGTNGYTRVALSDANTKGFMLPYGMQNEHEDLATYVQIIVWKPKDVIKRDYLSKGEIIKTKEKMVYEYYLNLGIDLYKLREYIHSNEMATRILDIKHKYEH